MRSIMHVTHPVSRLHLLLPFALPTAANAQPALQNLDKPALDRLLERATLVERVIGDDFQRTLPHERWVARCFGVGHAAASTAPRQQADDAASNGRTDPFDADDDAPLAPYMLLADGGEPRDAVWACVEPVHVQVAHDHLVLVDPKTLQLSTDDAAALLTVARPLIEELGVELAAPTPLRWYLSSEQLGSLASAAPLRAAGRNIEIWLPHEAHTGHRPRTWMKLQNEVQMAWFEHPVNQAREARGLPAANSIWLYAQGRMTPVSRPFERVLSQATATRGLALASGAALEMPPATFDTLRQQTSGQAAARAAGRGTTGVTLVELDPLSAPFVQQDWPRFRAAFAVLERDWFAPALAALERRELAELTLTLCGDTGTTTLVVRPIDMKKFWRRRSFASLLP
ncbi:MULTISPECIES: regulator [Mycetohabitans]|uniref:regulator n=1 Tax=Mycetohabitans TaxID=2571159 RepID=UPI001F228181|nr:regulator [Mycetohabitans sp. B3]MCF2134110.1 regulator [Mycetohabitans sp. B3]